LIDFLVKLISFIATKNDLFAVSKTVRVDGAYFVGEIYTL